jgi:hypothetical protein
MDTPQTEVEFKSWWLVFGDIIYKDEASKLEINGKLVKMIKKDDDEVCRALKLSYIDGGEKSDELVLTHPYTFPFHFHIV